MIQDIVNKEIVNFFFKNYKKDIETIDKIEFEILQNKISENFSEIIKLENSKDILLEKFSDYLFCFLHILAKFGAVEDLKKAIEIVGIKNINHGDINDFTPLHHCSISGKLDNLKALIGFGAKIDAKSSNETRNWYPIHYACKFGYKIIVEEFINAGLDKEVITSFGLTPLHIACEFGKFEVVEYLVSLNCNLDPETISENQKLSPIHYAIMINSYKIVELLIFAGANRFKKNLLGEDALIMASKRNCSQIIDLLLSSGVVDDLDRAYEVVKEREFVDSINIIEFYYFARKRLFNHGELIKISKILIDGANTLKIHNLNKYRFDIMHPAKITPYFLCHIKRKIGWLKKREVNLEQYAKHTGLDMLAGSLKKMNEMVIHQELIKKY